MTPVSRAHRNRFAIVSALVLSLTPVLANAAPADSSALPELVKRIQPAIVTIVGYDENDEPVSLGTGFFVDASGQLITNRHVVEGASRAEIKNSKGDKYPVEKVVSEDAEGDLIRLFVKMDRPVPTLRFAQKLPDPGERIIVIGSPFGLEQTVSDGIVSTIRENAPLGRMIQITAPISPGSSGSPVLNMDGAVLGVATITLGAGQNLNFAIPSKRATRLPSKRDVAFTEWAAETMHEVAIKAAEEGDLEKSVAMLLRAIKTKPAFPEAFVSLGTLLKALDKPEAAFEAFKEAIRIKPDFAEAHYSIAGVYESMDQWDDALASYREALRLNPKLALAHHDLGVALARRGEKSAALSIYEELMPLDEKLANDLFNQIYEARNEGAPVVVAKRVDADCVVAP